MNGNFFLEANNVVPVCAWRFVCVCVCVPSLSCDEAPYVTLVL